MNQTYVLARGRDAFALNAWPEARALLSEADAAGNLAPEDIDRLAMATHMTRGEASFDLWTRAHYEYLRLGDVAAALRCAFWLAFGLSFRGDLAQSSGWFSRASRLASESGVDCVETGYLKLLSAVRSLWSGGFEAAMSDFVAAHTTARRFGDRDLLAISGMGTGETWISLGEIERGLALLDEAMASVIGGQVSPPVVGIIYCAVLSCCQRMMDVRRSLEWTAAFTAWCESQTDLLPYRGDCIVYRAEVMQLKGAWPKALEEVRRATSDLDEPVSSPWAGRAFYQQAEIMRLSGDLEGAEEAYRRANHWGFSPQPGLSLLRLAQGQINAAMTALARALAETQEASARCRLLAAQIDALLEAGDIPAAAASADELIRLVSGTGFAVLEAVSQRVRGSLALAQGDAAGALTLLRTAFNTWRVMEMPYELAQTRVLMALACRALGDEDGASLELDAAGEVFAQLGARPDIERIARLSAGRASLQSDAGLTRRELEVLRLVAAGNTNRQIANILVLSEKTVARHVANIFARLGISNRSAATAYAYEQGLLDRST